MTQITLLVASDINGLIGINGEIPWKLKDDMKHFVKVTTNTICLFGRVTWEGLPDMAKLRLLDNNKIIVMSRTCPSYCSSGSVLWGANLKSVLGLSPLSPEIVVCGGAQIYEMFSGVADTIIHTRIQADVWYKWQFTLPTNPSLFEWDKQEWAWDVNETQHITKNKDNEYDAVIRTFYRRGVQNRTKLSYVDSK